MRFVLDNTSSVEEPWWVDVYLFDDIKNVSVLQEKMQTEGLELTIMNPTFVPSASCIQFAAIKALHAKAKGTMKCHSLYSEIIFLLYPTGNMREAFHTLGVSATLKSLLVISFHCSGYSHESVKDLIDGTEKDLSELPNYFNETETKKLYNITEEEVKVSSIEQSIITRMVAKGFLH